MKSTIACLALSLALALPWLAGCKPDPGSTSSTTAESIRRVHIFISGRVQGVDFRAFTRGTARELKLTGWVKNLPDGRVEAVIEGHRDGVAKLLKAVASGPSYARVDEVKTADEPPTGEFQDFGVIR